MRQTLNAILVLGLVLAFPALAVIETYQFENDEQRERYKVFTDELRCPKCQNQNLSGSNSPISADLRRELHRMLLEGKSDEEIIDYMVTRYGDFVLYRPPMNKQTAVLWLFPVGLLGIGAVVVLVLLRRRSAANDADVDVETLHRQAEDLLAQYNGKHDREEGK